MLVLGSAAWAFIIGSSCGIIATLNPSHIEFRQTLDELNYFAADKKLSQELLVLLPDRASDPLGAARQPPRQDVVLAAGGDVPGDCAEHAAPSLLPLAPRPRGRLLIEGRDYDAPRCLRPSGAHLLRAPDHHRA
eukprot:6299220-Prymnesium_polylepis.1